MALPQRNPLTVPLLGTHRPGIVVTPKTPGRPLVDFAAEPQRGTPLSAAVNLAATAMGAGVLTLPFAFARSGPLWCVLLLGVLAVATDLSLVLLLQAGRALGQHSLSGIMRVLFGAVGSRAFQLILIVTLFLVLTALQRIVLDVLPMVVEDVLGLEQASVPVHPLGLAVNLAVFVACLSKTFHGLRFTSGAALLCLLPFIVALVGTALARSFDSQAEEPPPLEQPTSLSTRFTAPPLLASALLCHFSLLDLDAEMQPKYREHMVGVIHMVCLGILPITYSLVSFAGISIFGADTSENVLMGFPGDRAMQLARFVLSLTNIFRMPLIVKPLFNALAELLAFSPMATMPASASPQSFQPSPPSLLAKTSATLAILLLTLTTASRMQVLTRVMGLLGGTAGVTGCYCMPGIMYLGLQRAGIKTVWGWSVAAVFVIGLGGFVVLTCLL